MTNLVDECCSFSALRSALRHDLVSWHGFSNPDAGKILNWFDPSSGEYLEHVDEWQVSLCTGYANNPALPIYHRTSFGTSILLDACPDQVGAIHQVAKLFYKWHGTPRRETNMNEVKQRLREPLPIQLDQFELDEIRQCLTGITSPDLNCCIGRFGPGATYEGFNAYQKWKRVGGIPDAPPNLFRVNPRDPWNPSYQMDGCTKIAEVPKSIKCNRIVSSEPAMYMYAQLAVNDDLVRQMHQLWPAYVSLDDQKRHNEALKWPGACSIDLSDASDHNQVDLVHAVLPQLCPVLDKVRSRYTQFPDGEIIRLATFAPMGSGVCFSVMTLVLIGILLYAQKVYRLETRRFMWFKVYGDDIIVPVWAYDFVIDLLARAGFVVNYRKSCCNLVYRESCGRELFSDTDITPCYIRDPLDKVDASKIEQIASHLEKRFFPDTARAVADLAQAASSTRYNRHLQRLEVCVRTTSARQKISSLDGWDGLNRWFSVHSEGRTFNERMLPGVAGEVWTKPAWRYKTSQDYPYLTTWLVTKP